MGETFKPEDVLDRKKRLRRALSDLSPGVQKHVEEILEKHSGSELRNRLSEVVGEEKAKRILRSRGRE